MDGLQGLLTIQKEGVEWGACLEASPSGPSLFAQESPIGLLGSLRFSTGLRERVSHLSLVHRPQPPPQGISSFPD